MQINLQYQKADQWQLGKGEGRKNRRKKLQKVNKEIVEFDRQSHYLDLSDGFTGYTYIKII